MRDKFVVSTNEIGEIIVTDVETDRVYRYDNISNFFGLIRLFNELSEENESLRKKCFELEKDYLIETSDISDNIYLDDEIYKLKQEYGVANGDD